MKRTSGLIFLSNVFILLLFLYNGLQPDPVDLKVIIVGIILIFEQDVFYFVGKLFNLKIDVLLMSLVFILASISVSTLIIIDTRLAIRQLLYFNVGFLIFIMFYSFSIQINKINIFKWITGVIAVLLFLLPSTPLGVKLGGATNWINLGGVSVQPSEFGKFFLILFLASVLYDYNYNSYIADIKRLILPLLVVFVCVTFLVKQNDLGTCVVIAILTVVLVYACTHKILYPVLAGVITVCAISFVISNFNHVKTRFQAWNDPWACQKDAGYQTCEGFYALSSGGTVGTDLKHVYANFVLVAESDYIFAVIVAEHGYLFGIAVIIISFLIFLRCCFWACRLKNNLHAFISLGIGVNFISNVFIIVAGIYNIIPLTGVAYPLVSAGGSSIVSTLLELGVLINFVKCEVDKNEV